MSLVGSTHSKPLTVTGKSSYSAFQVLTMLPMWLGPRFLPHSAPYSPVTTWYSLMFLEPVKHASGPLHLFFLSPEYPITIEQHLSHPPCCGFFSTDIASLGIHSFAYCLHHFF